MTTPHPQSSAAKPVTAAPRPQPRIYVACLAAYNAGHLHGRWIEATTPDEVMVEVRAMLADSPLPEAEEWAIHDHDGFEGAELSEYASFETACGLADFIAEHGRLGGLVHRHFGGDLEQARAAFDDYAGCHRSAADFAEALHRDTGTEIASVLEYYIDWSALARDMELNGDIMMFETGFEDVHVFWTR
ncbi:antirestriction protein ArdA [Henriciella sp.]|jgi:antirestriction protein|uniref:antirestriction protein ArdA n=1 Tax=Henriciella sp. TaxID=1968823 RepID=UPI000C47363D|nr:antirestriction protein ArdA [Henriciella sp.]MAN74218.1 antirestriction protein [Henriciella sp.]|tara:strand:+ start:74 stop:637 length:564 start_codon:yes stop_codon:yes gene_type:complete